MCAHGNRLRASPGTGGHAATARRGYRSDHSEAVSQGRRAHGIRARAVFRLALSARRLARSGLRAQPPGGARRDDPHHGSEFRLRIVARARRLGAHAVRLPRHRRAVVRGYLHRELLSERLAARAPGCFRGRCADPEHGGGGGGGSPPRNRRGPGTTTGLGQPRLLREFHRRWVRPRPAAARCRRNRPNPARAVEHRGLRAKPPMKTYAIAVLPCDGIGPEVIAQAVGVLQAVGERFELHFAFETLPIGAAAVAVANNPLPPETRAAVLRSDAVLLGAVGDPRLDGAPRELRPESGLLALRQLLHVYANLRPVAVHPALVACSPLKAERLRGVDVLVVRELTGGLYYGEPRGRHGTRAVNTLVYTAAEVERVARVAFAAARGRRRLVTSVDKANVLEVSQLWRETVTRVARDYPEVRLEHCYVDTPAMRLVSEPATFDVILTEDMFRDILR